MERENAGNAIRKKFVWYTADECDSLAAYLMEMARQGWRFRRWGTRLEFEAAPPEEAVYAVQIFDKAKKDDYRPTEEGLDFAEYCREAGWELMDARGRFYIFRRLREDAPEIVTPEERYESIRRNALKPLKWNGLFAIAAFALLAWYVLVRRQESLSDQGYRLFLVSIGLLIAADLAAWIVKEISFAGKRRLLAAGRAPEYLEGRGAGVGKALYAAAYVLSAILALCSVIHWLVGPTPYPIAGPAIILYTAIGNGVSSLVGGATKADHETKRLIAVVAICVVWVILMLIMVARKDLY
ncbi:MAG: DUF2812 domain-containing protein [Eubacterium sp.]|nr:DUF2812 domain-containing protein [Eubacterium sp.]